MHDAEAIVLSKAVNIVPVPIVMISALHSVAEPLCRVRDYAGYLSGVVEGSDGKGVLPAPARHNR